MRFTFFALLLVSLASSTLAQSEGSPYRKEYEKEINGPHGRCEVDWTRVARGLEYRPIRCLGDDELDVNVVRISLDDYTINSRIDRRSSARAVAGDRDAVFAMNANFFDGQGDPIGVIVSSGEVLHEPHRSSWQSIFLITKDGEPLIIMPRQWKSYRKRAWMAVQAGPRLVVNGHTNHVRESYAAARAGVCIQKSGDLVFFATPQTRKFLMAEIGRVTRRAEIDGGLECREAMLFDGGHSTQMFLEGDTKRVTVNGDPAPVFIYATKKRGL